jgi:WD40 repeat protein
MKLPVNPSCGNELSADLPSRRTFKYWGFISYAREDEASAEWLHRSLERYRIPRRLVGRDGPEGRVPPRLFPIYRDKEEIPASSDLGSVIKNALRDSHSLFVVCSPMAVASKWVNEEIRTFKQFGRESRIFGLIASGEPNSSSGVEGEKECFPIAIRFGVGLDGQVDQTKPVEPIAADIRKGRDSRANAKLRLIAGVIGVSFDELKQRDRRRRRLLFSAWSLASAALLICFIGVWSWQQLRITEQRKQAESERLAGQAELSGNENPTELERSALLAIESMRLEHSIGNDLVLRAAINLMPRTVSTVRFKAPVPTLTFSPDGSHLAAGSQDKTARVFETMGGKEVSRLEFQGPVNAVAFSPDGRYVAAGSGLPGLGFRIQPAATVFEAVGGKEVSRLKVQDAIESLAFSPDGLHLAASESKSVLVFEVLGGKEVSQVEFQGQVTSVAFSPDGRYVAAGSWDKTARVFEAMGGREVSQLEFKGPVDSVAFSPDGRYVAAVSWDKTARVFEVVGGKEVSRLEFQDRVNVAVFSPNGRYVAAGGYDNTARVFEAVGGKEVSLLKFQGPVAAVAFSPDGRYVGAGVGGARFTPGGAAVVFEAVGGEEVRRLRFQHVVSATFSPNRRYLAVGSWDTADFGAIGNAAVEVLETVEGKLVSRLECQGLVTSEAFSPDGRYVAAGIEEPSFGAGAAAMVFEAVGGKEVSRLKFQDSQVVTSVDFSPDGRFVAAGGGNPPLGTGAAIVFEAAQGKEQWKRKFRYLVQSVAFSPDGRFLAIAGGNPLSRAGTADVFEAAGKKEVSRLQLKDVVSSVAFSSDGRYVAIGSYDKTARVFETVGGREVSQLESQGPVVAVAFSPDGHYVAAGSRDNTVRVFDAVSGKEVSRLEFEGAVGSMVFSPDRRYLATAAIPTEGGLMVRLDLLRRQDLTDEACSRLTRNLTPEEWNHFLPGERYRKTCPNLP